MDVLHLSDWTSCISPVRIDLPHRTERNHRSDDEAQMVFDYASDGVAFGSTFAKT